MRRAMRCPNYGALYSPSCDAARYFQASTPHFPLGHRVYPVMEVVPSESAILVGLYQEYQQFTSIGLSVTTLIFYDWLLSMPQEVHFVWSKPKTSASYLYLFNRYIVILECIFNASTSLYPMSDRRYCVYPSIIGLCLIQVCFASCNVFYWTIVIIELGALICPALFSALRVYALTGQNRVLFGITLGLGLMPFLVNLGSEYQTLPFNGPSPINCNSQNNASFTMNFICEIDFQCCKVLSVDNQLVLLIARIPAILSDLIVIVVTWLKMYRPVRYAQGIIHGPTLHHIILESGTIYFVTLLALNAMQITFFILSIEDEFSTGNYIIIFFDPIVSTLISHFILSLWEANEHSEALSPLSLAGSIAPTPSMPEFSAALSGPVHSSTSSTNDTSTMEH